MKPTTNPVTGDKLITKPSNDRYRSNYDVIFGKKKVSAREAEMKNRGIFFCDGDDWALDNLRDPRKMETR